jgi:VanZ family protein
LTRSKIINAVALVWLLCLTVVSLQPYRPTVEKRINVLHILAHIVAFSTPALLLCLTRKNPRQEWIMAASVMAVGLFLETAQCFMYGIEFEWWDVRDDAIGIAIALLLVRYTKIRNTLLAETL